MFEFLNATEKKFHITTNRPPVQMYGLKQY